MKRHLMATAIISTVAMFAVVGCAEESTSGAGARDSQSGDIRIGAVLDITGPGASLGVPQRRTLELLAKNLNAAGGIDGRKVKLIIEDDQSAEDKAVQVTNKLITSDKVDVLLGASRSGPSLAMRPIAEQSEIPMISMASSPKIIAGSKWVFKTAQNSKIEVERFIDLAKAKGWNKLALLVDSSATGEGVQEMLGELGAPEGIKVVRTDKFAPDATDFTAQIVNVRNANADANIIWGIPPGTALALKAYRSMKLTAPVLLNGGATNEQQVELAGDANDGAIFDSTRLSVVHQLPDSDPQKKVIADFVAAYQAEYNQAPSTFDGQAADAFNLAVDAITKVGTNKDKVRDHLEGISGFVGITGVFTMSAENHSGLSKDAIVLVTQDKGKWKLFQ